MAKETKMIYECSALVTYKDGRMQIERLRLEGGLPFTQNEMREWMLEKKDVKSVVFVERPRSDRQTNKPDSVFGTRNSAKTLPHL